MGGSSAGFFLLALGALGKGVAYGVVISLAVGVEAAMWLGP